MIEQEYAGFWIRFGALMIDLVIMVIVIFAPLMVIYGEDYLLGEQTVRGFWDVFLNYIVPFITTIWFWMNYAGTPGKMATQLKIVDAVTGDKLSLGQAIGRYFAYIPATLPLGLGLIWVGVDKKKQGWHDKLAGTVVIKTNRAEPVNFNGRKY
jgi:uncharacterized RDD family membrane protein YckC